MEFLDIEEQKKSLCKHISIG